MHARRHRSEAVCTLQTRHQAVKPARESCRHNYRTSDRKSLMPVSDCIPVFGRGISQCLQSPRLPPNPAARSCWHSLHQAVAVVLLYCALCTDKAVASVAVEFQRLASVDAAQGGRVVRSSAATAVRS